MGGDASKVAVFAPSWVEATQFTQAGRTQFRLREREIHQPVNLRWDERCARHPFFRPSSVLS
ncbi:uncharacterized protein BDZ83DRAFT_597896 [Colletotrichum acutatum]|uniref:Uncharacterized protein n=1 Tax=Glomerella acutata TaxID=27357 RepID=A0AAD8XQG5_GLOAC|nr:uncharacterized protein BDZ83DRAFT_597896 [Colletotrichum acutatum]KAK1731553.1 hypothetical protein BDZ83DRAFT_597896 [Colletotrichum acutatum]